MKELNAHIKLLKNCNLHCSYCHEQNYSKDPRILSLSEIELILDRVKIYALYKRISRINIGYTGGEVLLLEKSYLDSVLSTTRRSFQNPNLKIAINIQTNLTLLDKAYVKLLKKYNVSVGVSFDVYGGQRKYKDGTAADETIIEKMIMMLKAGLHFGAIAVITRSNYKKGKEIYNFYKNISSGFYTLKLHPWTKNFCPAQIISAREYVRTLKSMAQEHLKQRKPNIAAAVVDSYIYLLKEGSRPGPLLCIFSKKCFGNNIFIENNGDIYPCCSLRYKELYLGNIFTNSLKEIFSSPILEKLKERQENIGKECSGCPYVRICSGGCMAYAYSEGNIMSRSKSWCIINRAMFKYIGGILKKRGEKLTVKI